MPPPADQPPERGTRWLVRYTSAQVLLLEDEIEWLTPPVASPADYATEQLQLLQRGAAAAWPGDVRVPPGVIRCEIIAADAGWPRVLGAAELVFSPGEP